MYIAQEAKSQSGKAIRVTERLASICVRFVCLQSILCSLCRHAAKSRYFGHWVRTVRAWRACIAAIIAAGAKAWGGLRKVAVSQLWTPTHEHQWMKLCTHQVGQLLRNSNQQRQFDSQLLRWIAYEMLYGLMLLSSICINTNRISEWYLS